LPEPRPLHSTAWIEPGAPVVPYGTMSAVENTLTDNGLGQTLRFQ
jgi:ornithine cyclodeaminase